MRKIIFCMLLVLGMSACQKKNLAPKPAVPIPATTATVDVVSTSYTENEEFGSDSYKIDTIGGQISIVFQMVGEMDKVAGTLILSIPINATLGTHPLTAGEYSATFEYNGGYTSSGTYVAGSTYQGTTGTIILTELTSAKISGTYQFSCAGMTVTNGDFTVST